jgi:cell division protein FtsQ
MRALRLPTVDWRAVAALAGGIAMSGGAWFVSAWLLNRPIETIVVNGSFQRVSPIRLEALIEPHVRAGFLEVDLDATRRDLETLPWIAAAEVRRKWPGTLEIQIREEVPIACWGERGLLNSEGKLFVSDADHVPAELPRLHGPPGTEALVTARYFRVQGELERRGMAAVAVRLDERGAWAFETSNGVEVRLGANSVEERIARFFQALDSVLAHGAAEMAYVDMRYPNGFAIGWKNGTQIKTASAREPRPNA